MTVPTVWAEVRAAALLVRSDADEAEAPAAALAWLPLAAAVAGIVAAAVATALGRWSSMLGGTVGLGVLRALEGPRATMLWLGLLALEAAALVPAPAATQALALVLAPTLGAWSRVVQCHGGRPPSDREQGALVGRATFREFGLASVLAIGGSLALFDAVGLVAVLAAVIPTLLLRAVLHRRLGGMPAWGPVTSGRVAGAVVIVVLALLSSARSAP